MALGTAWSSGGEIGLWTLTYDINADDRGFTSTFKVAEKNETDARAVAVDIGQRMLVLLPTDTEIYFAKISRFDSGRDALMIPEVMGPGLYQSAAGPPAVNPPYDVAQTCLQMRLEDARNTPVPFKWGPIPDNIVTAGLLTDKPEPVTGIPVAAPAASVITATYAVNLNNLMKTLVRSTHHIVSGADAGGAYTFFLWKNCYFTRVKKKRGGRVFIG